MVIKICIQSSAEVVSEHTKYLAKPDISNLEMTMGQEKMSEFIFS